jgi:hypothetical protein
MSFVAVAIGSAFVGTVMQVSANNKAQKQTKAAQAKQVIAAKNAATLKALKTDTGAKVKIGSAPTVSDDVDSATKGRSNKRKVSGSPLGGVSASTLGGL